MTRAPILFLLLLLSLLALGHTQVDAASFNFTSCPNKSSWGPGCNNRCTWNVLPVVASFETYHEPSRYDLTTMAPYYDGAKNDWVDILHVGSTSYAAAGSSALSPQSSTTIYMKIAGSNTSSDPTIWKWMPVGNTNHFYFHVDGLGMNFAAHSYTWIVWARWPRPNNLLAFRDIMGQLLSGSSQYSNGLAFGIRNCTNAASVPAICLCTNNNQDNDVNLYNRACVDTTGIDLTSFHQYVLAMSYDTARQTSTACATPYFPTFYIDGVAQTWLNNSASPRLDSTRYCLLDTITYVSASTTNYIQINSGVFEDEVHYGLFSSEGPYMSAADVRDRYRAQINLYQPTIGYFDQNNGGGCKDSTGQYCLADGSKCACSSGYWNSQTLICGNGTQCPAGQMGDASTAMCVSSCPAGAFYNSITNECLASCSAGYWTNSTAYTCNACPAGTYSSDPAASSPSSCQPCPAGSYSTTVAASSSLACQNCSAGSYSSSSGSSQCTNCALGTYSTTIAATSSGTCIGCASGSYGNTTGVSQCYVCSAGRYSTTPNATSSAACQSCPLGTYGSSTGATQCTNCTAGTYGIAIGMPSQLSACADCPNRSYGSVSGVTQCTNCTDGTYNNGTGNTSPTSCAPCTVGSGMYGKWCQSCPPSAYPFDPNTICDDGASGTGNSICRLPALMTRSNLTQRCDCSCLSAWGPSCSACADPRTEPLYTHCDNHINGTGNYLCNAPLTYQLQPNTNTLMCLCPPGSPGGGPACNETCPNCNPATSICDTSAQCICRTNFFRAMNMSSSPCDCHPHVYGANCTSNCSASCFTREFGQCNDGYLGDGSCTCGAYRVLDATSGMCNCQAMGREGYNCAPCPYGAYNSNVSAAACTECAIGTYSASWGASTCDSCGWGMVANQTGSTSCYTCAAGTREVMGSFCDVCPAGTFSPMQSHFCTSCPTGAVSAAGSSICFSCTAGSFAKAHTDCTLCGPGTFSTGPVDQCTSCSPGYFAAGVSNTFCTRCGADSYSNTSSASACTPCPSGWTNNPTWTGCVLKPVPVLYSAIARPHPTNSSDIAAAIANGTRFEVTLSLALSLDSIMSMDRFQGQLAMEIASLSSVLPSDVYISSIRAGSVIVDFNLPLTGAQVMQELVVSNAGYNATTYPLFSQSTQVIVQNVAGLVGSSAIATSYNRNCTDTVFPGRNTTCGSIGLCEKGICVCDTGTTGGTRCSPYNLSLAYTAPPGVSCYHTVGAPTVCESDSTTVNNVYYIDDCQAYYPSYRNVMPRRRYCQNMDRTFGRDSIEVIGVLGRPPALNCSDCDGTEPYWVYTLHLPIAPVADNQTGFQLQSYAYVTNLYDNQAPMGNKRRAWVEVRFKYDASTYLLSRLVFLPSIEGDAHYYYSGGQWVYEPLCQPGEYAYGPKQCECMAYTARNPLSQLCVPGCSNGNVGPLCTISLADAKCHFIFNAYTQYITYDCSEMVCMNSAQLQYGMCVPYSAFTPLWNTLLVATSSSSSSLSTLQIVVMAGGLIVSVLALGVNAWLGMRCYRRRTTTRKKKHYEPLRKER